MFRSKALHHSSCRGWLGICHVGRDGKSILRDAAYSITISGPQCAADCKNRPGSRGLAPRIPQVVESASPGVKENAGQQGTVCCSIIGKDCDPGTCPKCNINPPPLDIASCNQPPQPLRNGVCALLVPAFGNTSVWANCDAPSENNCGTSSLEQGGSKSTYQLSNCGLSGCEHGTDLFSV